MAVVVPLPMSTDLNIYRFNPNYSACNSNKERMRDPDYSNAVTQARIHSTLNPILYIVVLRALNNAMQERAVCSLPLLNRKNNFMVKLVLVS